MTAAMAVLAFDDNSVVAAYQKLASQEWKEKLKEEQRVSLNTVLEDWIAFRDFVRASLTN